MTPPKKPLDPEAFGKEIAEQFLAQRLDAVYPDDPDAALSAAVGAIGVLAGVIARHFGIANAVRALEAVIDQLRKQSDQGPLQ